ncbi:uncharacterized protein LAJ45_07309 [Morchella importuna]|uniref:uncharacterized protein n=1 Tax=Morchella importuna TaxID=1174673 RepID=UPI001E8E6367|nr:uncharacterized protein LAJ45_07309 [Morchella importuna]KAH8148598.1 hypothetical protein LAJ45_07309 [Morchella importuna]
MPPMPHGNGGYLCSRKPSLSLLRARARAQKRSLYIVGICLRAKPRNSQHLPAAGLRSDISPPSYLPSDRGRAGSLPRPTGALEDLCRILGGCGARHRHSSLPRPTGPKGDFYRIWCGCNPWHLCSLPRPTGPRENFHRIRDMRNARKREGSLPRPTGAKGDFCPIRDGCKTWNVGAVLSHGLAGPEDRP